MSTLELPELGDPVVSEELDPVSEELDPPLAELVPLAEEDELSGLVLLGGIADDPAAEDDDELGGVTVPAPGLLLLISLVDDDEDDEELGGVAVLPVPALSRGRCSPQAAKPAATAATAHSFANVRKVLSMSCTPRKW